jgi:hypothetical protein
VEALVGRLTASVAELASDATDLVCRLTGCLGATPVFAGLWQVAARQLLIDVGKFV